MKVQEVIKLCKKRKSIVLVNRITGKSNFEVNEQWLGDGNGYFLLKNCPTLIEENIYSIFDIKNTDRWQFVDRDVNILEYSLAESDVTEKAVETSKINISIDGKEYAVAFTSEGAVLVDIHYFKPFTDFESPCELFERKTKEKALYFVMKCGFVVVGVIIPQNYKIDNLYEELNLISSSVKETLVKIGNENFKKKKAEQINL